MLEKITLTFAQSLDGRIATPTGESRYISEEGSLRLNQKMRREYDAILIGIGTLIADDPMLTCRIDEDCNPLRVILDPALKIPLNSQIAQSSPRVRTLVFYNSTLLSGEDSPDYLNRIKALEQKRITAHGVFPDDGGRLNLKQVLKQLEEEGVKSLMVEGGSAVLTSFLKEKLWDNMIVVTAAKIIGRGVPAFGNLGIESLDDVITPGVENITIMGDEVCWNLVKPVDEKRVITRTVYFTAPGRVEIRTDRLTVPQRGKRLFRSRIMGISPGTEKQIYLGNFLSGRQSDPAVDCMDGEFVYPFAYGYINVVESDAGTRFLGFLPHTEQALACEKDLFPLKDDLEDENALFIPHLETAISIIHDSLPKLGDRVLIVGAGVIGTLTSRVLGIMGIDNMVFDIDPGKKDWFPEGIFCYDTKQLEPDWFDLSIEASGSPQGLQACMEYSGHEGRVTVASWYGEREISLNLGSSFHWKRLKLISSQVSNMSPLRGSHWNKARRLGAAADLAAKVETQDLLTHRIPFSQAVRAYQILEGKGAYGLIALLPGS